jgi:hypothetical protein
MVVLMVDYSLHKIATDIEDFSKILLHVHVIALFIINVTKVPRTSALAAKIYRVLEMVAGLLTPLAKR